MKGQSALALIIDDKSRHTNVLYRNGKRALKEQKIAKSQDKSPIKVLQLKPEYESAGFNRNVMQYIFQCLRMQTTRHGADETKNRIRTFAIFSLFNCKFV